MSLKLLTALACAASAFALSAADAATFAFDFNIAYDNGDSYIGSGSIFADLQGDGSYRVTGADGFAYMPDDAGQPSSMLPQQDLKTAFGWDVDADDNWVDAYIKQANGLFYVDALQMTGENQEGRYFTFLNANPFNGDTYTAPNYFASSGGDPEPNTTTLHLTLQDATSDVPEPASWAMLVGGFGLLGVALRRKRVSVSFG